ncbi:MAG TPA: class I SAM-dependent methyltransferase [Thermoleophilia bacterium]|nr:class I SAM-dependent methyltransferase [Thermoleophilia bacterium]
MSERDHKQLSRAAFDRQARDYDHAVCGRHARRIHGDVMHGVGRFDFSTVLDVGCGTGTTLAAILDARPGVHALGVDLSSVMIEVAHQRLGTRAELRVADAEHLPFGDGVVDLVVCVDSLHHYPHPERALHEMRRVTRPGGGLVLGEWRLVAPLRQLMNALLTRLPEGDVRVYTPRELVDLAAAAGYSAGYCEPAGVRGQLLVSRR